MQKVIIIGGQGSGTVIAQAILDANNRGDDRLVVEGFMSHDKEIGELIEGIPVVVKQSRDNITNCFNKGYRFIFALHRMDGGEYFTTLYEDLGLRPEMMATFIHPTAFVAPNVVVHPGAVILPYVMISAGAVIGANTLIMTGATIGHNTELSCFTHVASQAVVGAYIKTSIGTHVGLNATIREYITIGKYSTVGMGAVLTKNVGDHEMWAGNPAKFLRNAK
jgi:sugar O-acyltransferase (sialic acid O-acetyltransferase NeuD family)